MFSLIFSNKFLSTFSLHQIFSLTQ